MRCESERGGSLKAHYTPPFTHSPSRASDSSDTPTSPSCRNDEVADQLCEIKIDRMFRSFPPLTSPFFTVMDWRRGVLSSLMLDRKFCEIRRASWRRGWSGWLEGVCLSRSYTTQMHTHLDQNLHFSLWIWKIQTKCNLHVKRVCFLLLYPLVYKGELTHRDIQRNQLLNSTAVSSSIKW